MKLIAVVLLLVLASSVHCRPTFDRIAEILLEGLDDSAHYHQGGYPEHGRPGCNHGHNDGYGYQQGRPQGGAYYHQPRPVYTPPDYYQQPSRPEYYNPEGPIYYQPNHYGATSSTGGYRQRGY
ncbi:hypothetical protein KR074_000704 [Drosophila pseudoananassae]|nr:hypothetical protein KR074_000704 [Drosophila pseudoananassae]